MKSVIITLYRAWLMALRYRIRAAHYYHHAKKRRAERDALRCNLYNLNKWTVRRAEESMRADEVSRVLRISRHPTTYGGVE